MYSLFGLEKNPGIWWRSGIRAALVLGAGIVLATVVALLLSFLQMPPFDHFEGIPLFLVYALAIEIFAMLSLIAYSFAKMFQSRKGSKLQQRMVWLITLLIASPVTMVSLFSILFLDLGFESWFSKEIKTALEESQNVAESYLEEHRQSLSRDMLGIARDFDQSFNYGNISEAEIQSFLHSVTYTRNINQALIFEIIPSGSSRIIARAGITAVLEMDPVRKQDLERATRGELVLILGKSTDQARGLIRLRGSNNFYLYAGRYLSSLVVQQTEVVQGAVRNFTILENQLQELKIGFIIVFAVFSLLCVLVSIYLSMTFARSIAQPISTLTLAAREIGQGKLNARVDTEHLPQDETAELSAAFNSMAEGLQQSRSDLIAANADIARRQDYTDNILRSVSTGIVGLDHQGRVRSINQRAGEILDCPNEPEHIDILSFLPEISTVVHDPQRIPKTGVWQAQTQVRLSSGQSRSVLIRIAQIQGDSEAQLLLSIDDITELENAQRLAAWSEVAKRIAHEIRNPLTPIRLATERLRRKYPPILERLAGEESGVSVKDSEGLLQSTNTILRQVDSIALMVKEFSDFARMPKARFAEEDLSEICREAVFIEQNRHHGLLVEASLEPHTVFWSCDRRQIVQVLVNLLKNAAEAIAESEQHKNSGRIVLSLQQERAQIRLAITDNGPGWPEENRDKLFDPYNTSRESGSGLGLAIVQRIVHEHHGTCQLLDNPDGGAIVAMTFRHESGSK